jgi:hypothetical protein
MAKVVDAATLQEIQDGGFFENPFRAASNVPAKQLERYIEGVEDKTVKIWCDDNFRLRNIPSPHGGITICYQCLKLYWITQQDDAFPGPDPAKGYCCFECLSAPFDGEIVIGEDGKVTFKKNRK